MGLMVSPVVLIAAGHKSLALSLSVLEVFDSVRDLSRQILDLLQSLSINSLHTCAVRFAARSTLFHFFPSLLGCKSHLGLLGLNVVDGCLFELSPLSLCVLLQFLINLVLALGALLADRRQTV